MNKMLLSFVIPIYQVEDYVADCLYSICQQKVDSTDWFEIICVNDGSKDKSLDVVTRVACEYPSIRFKIIDKENEGVSVARNVGINSAEGEYLWFVDSDDVILQGALGMFYEHIVAEEYDLVSGLFYQTPIVDINKEIYTGKNRNLCAFYTSCIKRELLINNEISFAKGVAYGEDLLFFEMVNFFANKKLKLSNVVYAYRQREGSAMNNQNANKKYIDSLEKRLIIYTELDEKHGNNISNGRSYFLNLRDGVVRNIMLFHLRMQDKDASLLLDELREKGVYPYPLRFNDLCVFYALPDFLIKLLCFLFPYSWYYKLIYRFFSLRKKK